MVCSLIHCRIPKKYNVSWVSYIWGHTSDTELHSKDLKHIQTNSSKQLMSKHCVLHLNCWPEINPGKAAWQGSSKRERIWEAEQTKQMSFHYTDTSYFPPILVLSAASLPFHLTVHPSDCLSLSVNPPKASAYLCFRLNESPKYFTSLVKFLPNIQVLNWYVIWFPAPYYNCNWLRHSLKLEALIPWGDFKAFLAHVSNHVCDCFN